MMKQIRFSDVKSKRYSGLLEYLIVYDYNAGKSKKYSVFVLNPDDPVTIGRELPLSSARLLIKNYEELISKFPIFLGGRKDILKILNNFTVPKEFTRSK